MKTIIEVLIEKADFPNIEQEYKTNISSSNLGEIIDRNLEYLYILKEKCQNDIVNWCSLTSMSMVEDTLPRVLRLISFFYEIDDEIRKGLIIKKNIENKCQCIIELESYNSRDIKNDLISAATKIERSIDDVEYTNIKSRILNILESYKRRKGVKKLNFTSVCGEVYISDTYNYSTTYKAIELVNRLKKGDELSWICVNDKNPIVTTYEEKPIGSLKISGLPKHVWPILIYHKIIKIEKIVVSSIATEPQEDKIIATEVAHSGQMLNLDVYLTETNTE